MIEFLNRQINNPTVNLNAGDKVIVCEGIDEVITIQHIADSHNLTFRLLTAGTGEDRLDVFEDTLSSVGPDNLASVALVIDAELRTPNQVWRQVVGRYGKAGSTQPAGRNQVGNCVVSGKTYQSGVFICPGQNTKGALESMFIPQLQNDCIYPSIRGLIAAGHACGIQHANEDKVLLRSFLAMKTPSNTGLNPAIRTGILDVSLPEFQPLTIFLQTL